MRWQRIARLVIAVAAIAFAIAVAATLRRRAVTTIEAPLTTTDPKAVAQSEGGQTFRVNREHEDVRVHYDRLVTYQDATSKMLGVTVTTERSGRVFTIAAREGQVGKDDSVIELDGDVKVVASDGLELTTAHATYTQADGNTRVPGAATFSRGRMTGSGMGMLFNEAQNVLTILDQARVKVVADAKGRGAMDIAAGALEFRRGEHTMLFERSMTATRGGEVIMADSAVAHLTADEQHLEALELRGNSSIRETTLTTGGLEAMTGQDMNLQYGPGGEVIQHAIINGNAVVQLAGEGRGPGRQISGNVVEMDVAPDGATLTGLAARENVRVNMPADATGIARSIASQTLDSKGDDRRGLTSARFSGAVQFTEKGPQIDRAARSAVLDVAVGPGFSTINDARFAQGVRFADGDFFSTSALARYVLDKGTLELTGSEPGSLVPHIVNDQMAVDAVRVDVTLDGPILKAAGTVKSILQPRKAGAPGRMKVPSMLKQDQPVNVTADALDYRGRDGQALYTGNALLWQGETQIKAPTITIDSTKGDLETTGPVATVAMLVDEGKDGGKERRRSLGSAAAFHYEDALHRAVYTGEAHLRGPQGDLTADRIELFLKDEGEELDRLKGYDTLTLRTPTRKTTGTRLTYLTSTGRYVVSGAPVKAIDECGRETVGRTLTFFRATDRIVVDGNETARTQTTGKSNCPGT